MSFFIKRKQVNGTKHGKFSSNNNKKRKTEPNKSSKDDEEITSSSEDELRNEIPDASESEDENETAQDKKLRLAKVYLQEIEKEEKARLEKEEIDHSVLSSRLKSDYLNQVGKLRFTVADKYKSIDSKSIKQLKSKEQHSPLTCLCISSDNQFIFVGSKDCCIVKYSLKDSKKVGSIPFVKQNSDVIKGHSSCILSLAISDDSKFLAVGDESADIQIWQPNTLTHIKTLKGHKKSVNGLCFKRDSHTLYSCSHDRTAKIWNLDEMAYVETLFGHQDGILSIDTLYKDRVLSCGGRDIRIFKIIEESQLIYNGHVGNIDNARLLNEENFITGGDDGQICIWSFLRKKPLCFIENAHDCDPTNGQPYWITALAPHINTDLVATGSQDGFVRLWKLENNYKSISLLFKIPIDGFVNSMTFTSDGQQLIVAAGKEHRFGRWNVLKKAKNSVYVIPFITET